jgi:hypothetical protein
MLLPRNIYENSNIHGIINPAATEDHYVLQYGSSANGMLIVDRLGSTLELIVVLHRQ